MKVSKTLFALSLGTLLILGISLVGCRSFLESRMKADVRCGAMDYVQNLKNCGNLPGFTSEEHGDFSMDAGKIVLGVGIKYPLQVYIYATKIAEGSVWPSKIPKGSVWYCYELSKETESKEWRLVKAWKQEKEGRWMDLPLQGTAEIVTASPSVTTNEPAEHQGAPGPALDNRHFNVSCRVK